MKSAAGSLRRVFGALAAWRWLAPRPSWPALRLPSRLRLRPAWRWIWVLVLAALAGIGIAKGWRGKCVDFEVYWRATQRFLDAAALYRLDDGKMQFKYPPAAAWLLLPWTLFGPRLGAALWNATGVAALAWSARRLRKIEPWAPAVAVAALAPAFFRELAYGQVDLVIAALLIGAMSGIDNGRRWAPGLALAAAALLKPPAIIAALYGLSRRRVAPLAIAVLAGAGAFVPVVVIYGPDGALGLVAAWRTTLTASTLPWVRGATTLGVPTLLLDGFGEGVASAAELTLAQLAATALFVVLIMILRPRGPHLIAVICLGAALLSPLAWRANFVLAWPALALLLSDRGQGRGVGGWLAGLLAATGVLLETGLLADETVRRALAHGRPYTWLYAALLAAVAWRGRRRDGEEHAGRDPEE